MSDVTINTITTDDLRKRLGQGGSLEFWNVLDDEWFSGELIPGSRRVPFDRVGVETSRLGLAKDAEVIVYCSGPTCPSSRVAAEKLVSLGYTRVRAYEDGLAAWRLAGLPLERVATTSTV